MVAAQNTNQMKARQHGGWPALPPAVRYWLFWGLLMAGLAYGFHRYFEYRDRELDKRLEQLQ